MIGMESFKNASIQLMIVGASVFVCCGFSASGYVWRPAPDGITENLVRKIVSDVERGGLFALTDRGVYRLAPGAPAFELCMDFGMHAGRAYDLYVDETVALASTQRGIWVSRDGGRKWMFDSGAGRPSQPACYSLFHYQSWIFCGTETGMFLRRISDNIWRRVDEWPDETSVFEITGAGSTLFAASAQELFRLECLPEQIRNDFDGTALRSADAEAVLPISLRIRVESLWRASYADGLSETDGDDVVSSGDGAETVFEKRIIRGMSLEKGILWAAMQDGIRLFEGVRDRFGLAGYDRNPVSLTALSDQHGLSVPVLSLPAARVNTCIIVPNSLTSHERRASEPPFFPFSEGPKPGSHLGFIDGRQLSEGRLWAATEEGVFCFFSGRWNSVYAGLPTNRIIDLHRDASGQLFAATDRGVFYLQSEHGAATEGFTEVLAGFSHEPTVDEVRMMVITYADVAPEKIRHWKSGARARALIPSVSLNFSRDASDLYHWDTGASPDELQKGREITDWGISLNWDLSNALWSSDMLSIDSRSKLMVELREELLSRAVRLYFERRRLQAELSSGLLVNDWESHLRLEELTAQLDGMTGGQFSRAVSAGLGIGS